MVSSVIEQILIDAELHGWRSLPESACHALEESDAPPRLIAHLVLVHDAAASLIASVRSMWPQVNLDWEAIAIGASIHDIGKAFVNGELVGPGKSHERLGESFLLELGFAERFARYARTHGLPANDETLVGEDLLVILADKVWKGYRNSELEERVALMLSGQAGLDYGDVYPALLDLCELVANGAEQRLIWRSRQAT